MNAFKRILAALSAVAPDLVQAEVAAGLGFAVVLFHLNISDAYRAALIGAVVMVFTVAQVGYKIAAGMQPAK
jgi:hypothetical protein